jgi:predicted glycoside hydrolase/deacetylase ChbG (UPF0249 family)
VPDRFLDGFYAEGATVENLRRMISGLEDGTAELMCHPGRPDAELLAASTYAVEREREVQILCDPAIRLLLDERGIELVAFEA